MLCSSALTLAAAAVAVLPSSNFFVVQVLDAETNRGVPLIWLETTSHIRVVTDSNGVAVFTQPELLPLPLPAGEGTAASSSSPPPPPPLVQVWLSVYGPGYFHLPDDFGFPGETVDFVAGGKKTIYVYRNQASERLYRMTGAGIYAESVVAGIPTPLKHPLINSGVVGQDSTQATVHNKTVHWFFGDTNKAGFPLGNFYTTGATSSYAAPATLPAQSGVDLDYFSDAAGNFVAPMAPPSLQQPAAPNGPVWVGGLASLGDGNGELVTFYTKVGGGMAAQWWGMLQFDAAVNRFVEGGAAGSSGVGARWNASSQDNPLYPLYSNVMGSHSTVVGDGYVYFTSAYPAYRAPATVDALSKLPQMYEAWTCLEPGTTVADGKVVRDPTSGNVIYSWTPLTPALTEADEKALVVKGVLKQGEGWINLSDAKSGGSVALARGSTHWNKHIGGYLLISEPTAAGQIWVAKSETAEITGPYRTATMVAAHNSTGSGIGGGGGTSDTGLATNCYNPTQHTFMSNTTTSPGDEVVYFSCTFVTSFAPLQHKTERYDYNSLVYRLNTSLVWR